jgi:PBP1b-binding outer membrane lipoprotein LpoB
MKSLIIRRMAMKPRFFSVLFMAAFLVACQRNEEDNVAATEPPPPAPVVLQDFLPLPVESVNQSFTQEKCKKNCAEVKASLLKFSSDEVLTTELEKALVKLAQTGAATSDVDTMSG